MMNYTGHGFGIGGFGGGGGGAPPPPRHAAPTTTPTTAKNDDDPAPELSSSLESKVQGMASALRGERDKAHRSQMLAVERLNLTTDEVKAARSTLLSLAQQLQGLHDGMRVQHEVTDLRRHVEDLKKQVSFQHDELVTMLDQHGQQERTFRHADAHRRATYAKLHEVVMDRRRQRRSHSSHVDDGDLVPPTGWATTPDDLKMAIDALRSELEDDGAVEDERWRSGLWVDLVLAKAHEVDRHANMWNQETDTIQFLLEAYRRHVPELGGGGGDDDNGGGFRPSPYDPMPDDEHQPWAGGGAVDKSVIPHDNDVDTDLGPAVRERDGTVAAGAAKDDGRASVGETFRPLEDAALEDADLDDDALDDPRVPPPPCQVDGAAALVTEVHEEMPYYPPSPQGRAGAAVPYYYNAASAAAPTDAGYGKEEDSSAGALWEGDAASEESPNNMVGPPSSPNDPEAFFDHHHDVHGHHGKYGTGPYYGPDDDENDNFVDDSAVAPVEAEEGDGEATD